MSRNICLFLILFQSAILFLNHNSVYAQLSPGDLNRVHENLEGLKNCEQCHEAGKQVDTQKCLGCHKLIAQRLDDIKGLHGLNDYRDCIACHVEHLGRDSELIFWPDGRENFDHSLTGYILRGKHAELKCRQCHQASNIAQKEQLTAQNKDIEHTFLGLSQACARCHRDEHRGQLGDACLNCHDFRTWKPAVTFNHAKTNFALTGKHQMVPCDKCHPVQIDNQSAEDRDYLKFTGIPHAACLDCHADIHKGKFGAACATCHNTSGWQAINQAEFDHSKTHFPLRGKHAAVACEKCHKAGQPVTGLSYGRCTDCHSDYHKGQFAGRLSHGECDECHSVYGFTPTSFSVEMHQKTGFPLTGSHLAVPCIACHNKYAPSAGTETIKFAYESTRCGACHKDPHAGEADKYIKAGGCEYCHNVNSWRAVSFDHKQTKFPLEGKHATIKCRECHKPVKQELSQHSIGFGGLQTYCQSCHKDVHQGQFAKADESGQMATDCGKCHSPKNWVPDKFDHNQTAFKLEGAHKKVVCTGCHKKVMKGDREFTWFKPIDKSCESCHGNTYDKKSLGDS
jgi:hypothetical protein